jgi:RNA polymerase sigma-70 factor (ECF subfamily)
MGESATCVDRRMAAAVTRHRDRVASVLGRSGLGSGDVDDLVQEAFWILAQRLDAVPERAERSFLLTTALRLASDRRRSAWHKIMSRDLSADDWDTELTLSSDEVYERQEARQMTDAAVAELPDDERSVFLLVELEAMSRQEAAQVLSLPSGTVASRLARAKARFDITLRELSCRNQRTTCPQRRKDDSLVVGNLLYHTNAWGADKTRGRFDQRLFRRTHGGATQLGWHWYWPGLDRSVFAYPEVLVGYKPWHGGRPTDGRFPMQICDARRLVVDYAADTCATGSHNLAISTWLSRSQAWTHQPDLSAITTEIMVWPDYTPGTTPQGRVVNQLSVDGDLYEVWYCPQFGRSYKKDDEGWTVIVLRGVSGCRAGKLPLGEMVTALGRLKLVDPEQYLTCVELGNEVMGGAGTTFIERFAIEL